MKRMLINATQFEEVRVALVDGQELYDLNIEIIGNKQKKLNIYKGKITRIEPSLEAVFVDYGTKRHGFLPLKEVSYEYFSKDFIINSNVGVDKLLKKGQELIVQINKEERSNKGAFLTTFVSLAGSYLVLMPNNPKIGGISKRISGLNRSKIKDMLLMLKLPKGMGIIVRTAGLGKTIELLQCDLNFRIKHWENIKKNFNNKIAPCIIHQENNIIMRSFRDYLDQDIGEILIDNPKLLTLSYQYMKFLGRLDFLNKIKLYKGNIPLFSYYQIESQINSAFQRKVDLISGGSIIIDSTEALTTIDINSSKSRKGTDIEETAFNTNLEAVNEISKQLKIRDIGGLIVIDFIDMNFSKNQKIIENRLKFLVKKDKARTQISHISQFGLLEMSRERLNLSIEETSYHICPRCRGFGKIRDNKSLSLLILRLIEEEFIKENIHEVHAIVPINVAFYLLNEKRKTIDAIEKKQKNKKVIIIPSSKFKTPDYSILCFRKDKTINSISYSLLKLYKNNKSNFFNINKKRLSLLKESIINKCIVKRNVLDEEVKKINFITILKKLNLILFFKQVNNFLWDKYA